MAGNLSFIERNRAATQRLRTLATRLSDAELLHPVGEHWTVAITLAHLAFWDRRVLQILGRIEEEWTTDLPIIDMGVNDLLLPFWAAMPPRAAAELALESAEALDWRLEELAPELLELLTRQEERWVVRAIHRNLHLDEVEAALNR